MWHVTRLPNARPSRCGGHLALYGALVEVMATALARLAIGEGPGGREQVLPGWIAARRGDFPGQRAGNRHPASTRLDIPVVQRSNVTQLARQVIGQRSGQHRQPVVPTLAGSHHDLASFEGQVLDADRKRLQQAQAGRT